MAIVGSEGPLIEVISMVLVLYDQGTRILFSFGKQTYRQIWSYQMEWLMDFYFFNLS